MSIVSICLVCNFSIVATCPSMPAARFAFCLWFVCFFLVLLFIVVLAGEPKQNQGRGLVDRKLVLAPPPPPNFIAGRPKATLLFFFVFFLVILDVAF